FPNLSSNKRKEFVQKIFKNKEDNVRMSLENAITENAKNIGICCFSKSNKTSLMWSHYGRKHTGVCLGFSMGTFKRSNNLPIFAASVKYSKSINTVNYFKETNKALFNWLLSKSKI